MAVALSFYSFKSPLIASLLNFIRFFFFFMSRINKKVKDTKSRKIDMIRLKFRLIIE